MILADTSIWIDHLRRGDELLAALLDDDRVAIHPFVIGELAIGNLRDRPTTLRRLRRLPSMAVARNEEVLRFIDQERLFGAGIGYVDAHLLAAARLTPDATLWTRDVRLKAIAERLHLSARMTH